MGISLALGVSAVAGAGASLYAANKGSKAAKEAAAKQDKYAGMQYDLNKEFMAMLEGAQGEYAENAERLMGESRGIANEAYNRIRGIISGIPSLESLFGRGEKLSRQDFDYRTGVKRENLSFILGDTAEALRESQEFRSELANLEEGAFTNRFGKIIRSNMLGLKALTVGEPTGSFANLSAKNLYDISSKALGEYLAINDFYAKEGTVDPISPYNISQDLFTNSFNVAGLNINNEQFRANTLIGINAQGMGVEGQKLQNAGQLAQMGMSIGGQYYGALGQNAGASAAADAMKYQGIAQSIGTLTQGLAGAAGIYQQNQTLGMQKEYQQALINRLNSTSLQGFAPSIISASGGVSSSASSPTGSSTTEALPRSYTPSFYGSLNMGPYNPPPFQMGMRDADGFDYPFMLPPPTWN
jgi:hypothetical protein